jgi:hypothetical protein
VDRLPPDVLAQLRTFNFAGEWAELADDLAAALMPRKVPLPTGEQGALRLLRSVTGELVVSV